MSAVMQTAFEEAGIPASLPIPLAVVAEPAAEAVAKRKRNPKPVAVAVAALDVGFLKGFLADIETAEPGKAEATRMSQLWQRFTASGTETVAEATKGLTEGLKKGEATYSYAHKCASEIRTLYGAFRYVDGFKPRGYKASVAEAREQLKTLHRDWKGGHVDTPEEKKCKAMTETEVAVFKAERKAFHDATDRGASPAEVEAATSAAREAATRELGKARAAKLAEKLCEKYDAAFIEQLIECLMDRASGYGPVKTTDKLAQAE